MGELRWILLLAGLVFLAALAAWEHLRPRQGRRDESAPSNRSERSEPPMGAIGSMGATGSMSAGAAAAGGAEAAEDAAPPGSRIYTGASLAGGRTRAELPPRIDLPPLEPMSADSDTGHAAMRMSDSAIVVDEPISAHGPGPAADAGEAAPYYVYVRSEPSNGGTEHPPPGALPGEMPRPPLVDWPPESERHILSLRIAALSNERLSGRVVRLALGACGFEHGRFGIFHQPGADGRALLSAANLSKPGIFDLPNMDFQRFSGLSLFAVLPGPLPPAAALDHLLDTAQDLAERLRARLQDEQGLALGATQLEALRRTVQDLTQAAPAEPTS
jgi:FtsZ-interacting cell division protein ZipA